MLSTQERWLGTAGSLTSQKPVSGQPVNSDRSLDTSAFIGTNPRDEPVSAGLPVIRPEPSSWLVETPATELLGRYDQKRQRLFLLNDRALSLFVANA